MLIDVFDGRDRAAAKSKGSFHFARSPHPGEHVQIDGTARVVTQAWHQPSIYYLGAKFAILVSDEITSANHSEPAIPIYDDAGEVV